MDNATGEVTNGAKRVYFAGPLFCQAEKEFNLRLCKVLKERGYTVFMPQCDGYESCELEGKPEEELCRMLFNKDLEEILKADILFFNLDGRVPDEGACVELGIAYAHGKRCYGYKSDIRTAEQGLDLNPMIAGCLTHLFRNDDGEALIRELSDYLADNEL